MSNSDQDQQQVLGDNETQMKYHDNNIDFYGPSEGKTLSGLEYTITGYSITSGQDPDGKISNGQVRSFNGSSGTLTFRVGRKGNSSPANWWSGQIRATENTFGHNPDKLNFAFNGTLKLKVDGEWYIIPDCGIAQGHTNSANNWWFGAKGATLFTVGPIVVNMIAVKGTSSEGKVLWFVFLRGIGAGPGIDGKVPQNAVNRVDIISITTEKPKTEV